MRFKVCFFGLWICTLPLAQFAFAQNTHNRTEWTTNSDALNIYSDYMEFSRRVAEIEKADSNRQHKIHYDLIVSNSGRSRWPGDPHRSRSPLSSTYKIYYQFPDKGLGPVFPAQIRLVVSSSVYDGMFGYGAEEFYFDEEGRLQLYKRTVPGPTDRPVSTFLFYKDGRPIYAAGYLEGADAARVVRSDEATTIAPRRAVQLTALLRSTLELRAAETGRFGRYR